MSCFLSRSSIGAKFDEIQRKKAAAFLRRSHQKSRWKAAVSKSMYRRFPGRKSALLLESAVPKTPWESPCTRDQSPKTMRMRGEFPIRLCVSASRCTQPEESCVRV